METKIKIESWKRNLKNQTPTKRTYPTSTELLKKMDIEYRNNTQLTWNQVKQIRRLYKSGNYTYKELGKRFEVSESSIGIIIRFKTLYEYTKGKIIWKKNY